MSLLKRLVLSFGFMLGIASIAICMAVSITWVMNTFNKDIAGVCLIVIAGTIMTTIFSYAAEAR